MHSIRVIEINILLREEDEGSTHEDVHSALCPLIIDEEITNEEGKLTQELSQRTRINLLEVTVRIFLLYTEDVQWRLLGKDSPVVLEDTDPLNREIEPL